jgi:hypothetical protein
LTLLEVGESIALQKKYKIAQKSPQ